MTVKPSWEPPAVVTFDDVLRLNAEVTALQDMPIDEREDVFRLHELEMDWDIGVVSYQPSDRSNIPTGPDGKKVGIFLLHGGVSDFKSVQRIARTLAGKYGIKVASLTFPGRYYFHDANRDWPGDVENPDGSARTPLWAKETKITKDQYTVVKDTSKRENYGTLVSLAAKEGTEFYHRMAAWPVAFEQAVKETARRQFPEGEFSDLHARPLHRRAVRHDGVTAGGKYRRPGRLGQFAVWLDVSIDQRRRLGVSIQSIAATHLARHGALHVRRHER